MEKVKEIMSNFRSNAKLFIMRLSAGIAVSKLRETKKRLHFLHISNEGISEDSVKNLIARDAEDQTAEVMKLLYKARMEKYRIRKSSLKQSLNS